MKEQRVRVFNHRLYHAYLSALFLLLAICAISFGANTVHKVNFPFGDDDEGAVWWEAAHITNLRVLYHPIQQYPYIVDPYPPVYDVVTWLVEKGTGNFLIAGRLVSVFSALGICVLVGLIVWNCSTPQSPMRFRVAGATLGALLCLRLDTLNAYIPEMGVDLLAVFLSFLGIYVFLRYSASSAARYMAFAIFVAAIFTKQTMVAAPSACLVATALVSYGKALRSFLFCLFLGGSALGLLYWATGGEILRHLFVYNAAQPFGWSEAVRGLQANVIIMVPILAVSCLALLPVIRRIVSNGGYGLAKWIKFGTKTNSYRLALVVLGIKLILAMSLSLSYGKNGAGVHYFLEWNFVCCPLAGLLFVRILCQTHTTSQVGLGQSAVLLLLLFAVLTGLPDSIRRINNAFRLSPRDRAIEDSEYSTSAAALNVLKQTQGPVWCGNMLLTMEAHKEPPLEPGIQEALAKAGIWDESGFVNMITTQKFGAIVLRDVDMGNLTNKQVQAIETNYLPEENIGGSYLGHYTVYRPRPREHRYVSTTCRISPNIQRLARP